MRPGRAQQCRTYASVGAPWRSRRSRSGGGVDGWLHGSATIRAHVKSEICLAQKRRAFDQARWAEGREWATFVCAATGEQARAIVVCAFAQSAGLQERPSIHLSARHTARMTKPSLPPGDAQLSPPIPTNISAGSSSSANLRYMPSWASCAHLAVRPTLFDASLS